MKVPERWLKYKKSARIKDTPFVACKTPLKNGYSQKISREASFTPRCLLKYHPQVKLVINLTNTEKYYDGNVEFVENGIHYVHIPCCGANVVPCESLFQKFVNVVEEFLLSNPGNHLIAVHCTHGVNRTGYFLTRFMVERMGFDTHTALQTFAESRGHPMERCKLIKDLLREKNQPKRRLKYTPCGKTETLDSWLQDQPQRSVKNEE